MMNGEAVMRGAKEGGGGGTGVGDVKEGVETGEGKVQ